jgi:hypothetical protein
VQLLTVSSCSRHRTVAVVAPESFHGESALTILTPSRSGAQDSRYEEVIPPRPIGELSGPAYPEQPLKAGYGAASVVVRVFLDSDGQVIDIKDSPLSPSTGGRYSAEFRSAVEDAVHQWKFVPAEYRQFEQGKDLNGDGKPDYMVLVASKPVPVHFDARFDFSIVKGKGRVQSR